MVLTLEYLPGTKISDTARLRAADLDTQLLARRATECYLIQILKHGFLHADCHPGNIAVDPSGASALATVHRLVHLLWLQRNVACFCPRNVASALTFGVSPG